MRRCAGEVDTARGAADVPAQADRPFLRCGDRVLRAKAPTLWRVSPVPVSPSALTSRETVCRRTVEFSRGPEGFPWGCLMNRVNNSFRSNKSVFVFLGAAGGSHPPAITSKLEETDRSEAAEGVEAGEYVSLELRPDALATGSARRVAAPFLWRGGTPPPSELIRELGGEEVTVVHRWLSAEPDADRPVLHRGTVPLAGGITHGAEPLDPLRSVPIPARRQSP